jgi:hypothetical protein
VLGFEWTGRWPGFGKIICGVPRGSNQMRIKPVVAVDVVCAERLVINGTNF